MSYLNLLQVKFNFLASLSSWGDRFESRLVRNPEDRFYHVEAHTCDTFINLPHKFECGFCPLYTSQYGHHYNHGLSLVDDISKLFVTRFLPNSYMNFLFDVSVHHFLFSFKGVCLILFVWFDSLRPINNLSVIKGRVFLGRTSTKLG